MKFILQRIRHYKATLLFTDQAIGELVGSDLKIDFDKVRHIPGTNMREPGNYVIWGIGGKGDINSGKRSLKEEKRI